MMFWIIIAVISFIIGIFLTTHGSELAMIIGIFCILIALLCGVSTTVDYCHYQEFKIRYNIVENDYRLMIINEETDENLTTNIPLAFDISGVETESHLNLKFTGNGTISYIDVVIEN